MRVAVPVAGAASTAGVWATISAVTLKEKLATAIGAAVFAAIALLALKGYVHPAMLIDFANLRLCG